MAWIYLRHSDNEDGNGEWYAGRTGNHDFHKRQDSGGNGPFAVGMDGKEVAVKLRDDEDAHYVESEAIQFLRAFVGFANCRNQKQLYVPRTGYQWRE